MADREHKPPLAIPVDEWVDEVGEDLDDLESLEAMLPAEDDA